MQNQKETMTLREFLYRLWFTRDDDLDVLQVLFTIIVVVTLMVTWHVITDVLISDIVKVEGLITLRWLTGLLVITAVPKWLVPFISEQTKTLTSPPAQTPDTWTDTMPSDTPLDGTHRWS